MWDRDMTVLFYVSGHGYGHATRVAEILRAGAGRWDAIVRTTAPARLFPRAAVEHAVVDAAVAESPDTLRIDVDQTRRNWSEFVDSRVEIIEREAAWVRRSGARLIVADIPFLAGEIGAAAGVPCVGVSNFTWSWILEPFLGGDAEGRRILEILEAGYGKMSEYWRLPFSHYAGLSIFPRVIETPLIAVKPTGQPPAIREGFERVVLMGFRGRISEAAFRRAAEESPDTLFLTFEAAEAAGVANAQLVEVTRATSFQDLAAASDVVIAKLGYGLVSGCVAGKNRLLYAPREGFREDEITGAEAARYTALRAIGLEDFQAGRWRRHIDAVLAQPLPAETIGADGAAVCAERIARLLGNDNSLTF
jgi:hypothetical protein